MTALYVGVSEAYPGFVGKGEPNFKMGFNFPKTY